MQNYLKPLENKTAVVTGASSGIGRETTLMLAHFGVKVIALARRKNRLNELEKIHPNNIQGISGDINSNEFIQSLIDQNTFDTDILINNAGLAIGKDLFHNSIDKDNDLVIQTNINSAFKIAKYSLKSMIKNQSGDIVNICSIASHEAYSGGVVYASTKHALLAMSKALREETYGQNIRVMNISPGMVETEFSEVRFKGDKNKAKKVYSGFTPLTPKDIAFQIIQALRCPRHVNIDEILILATDQAGATKVKKD